MTETGEEGEYSTFQGRGRLYHFVNGQWTEKGSGVIKLNTVYDVPEEDEHGGNVPIDVHVARLIMRAAATHKVILNARIFKEMSIGDNEGNEPKGKSLLFSVPVDGKLVPHTLKVYVRSTSPRVHAADISIDGPGRSDATIVSICQTATNSNVGSEQFKELGFLAAA